MLRSITSNRRAAWARVELAVGKRRPRLTVQRLEDRVNPVSGTFELDGDATSDVTHDWDHVYNDVVLNPSQNTSGSIPGAVTFLHDAVNSPTDDVFTGGQTTDLNDLTEWSHKVGTPPDKADIADVFAAAYEVPVGGTNHTLLTFGADQFHFGGNSSLGFWFFQNPISANANGTFSGTHAAGDVLLLADFSGPVAEIRAFEWVGPSGSAGALQPLPANDDILIARVNNTNTPSGGWPFTDKAGTNPPNTFAPGEFVEAAIDVTALGLGNHIRSFLVETRASNSVNAPLQDFVLVNFNTFTADLTVTKTVNNATPNVGDTVTFTVSVTNKGPNNATGVHLSDVLPPGLAFVSATPSQGTYHTATGAWNVGSLAIGSSATLTLEARVLSQPPNQPPITNTARVTGEAQTDPDSTNDSASVTITPQKADLAVTKVVSDSSPDLGDVISYTITLTNLGPNDAAGVQLRDRLPAGLRFVSASQTQGTYDEVSGIWNVGSLANGASATLVLTAEVTSSAPGTNIARITDADQFDPVTANNSASAPLNAQQVDLVVGKTVSNARPIEGAVVTFVVSVTNRGPNTATNVVLRDVVPAGLTVVSALPSQGAYNPGTGMWTVGAVTTAIPATLQILARVDTAAAKLNLATVIAVDQPDTNPANNSASVSVIPQQSDLAVTKTVSNPRPDVGETVVFTIQVKNNGKSVATGVQINDLVPAGLTLLSASPSQGVYDSASGTWTVGTIIAGATANLQLTVDVTTPDRTTNTASVLALDQFDPVAANDSASATITPRLADLAVTKTVNNPTPNVGDIVTFTVTVRNNGPDTAENIQITDQLPDGYTLISISRSRGIFSAATEVWTIPSLAVGATATLTIRARVDAPTTAPNVATITAATTFDPISANNSAQAGTTVRQADLVVAKAVDNPSPNVGDTVSFTVTVTNTGPDTATNVRVNDLLPAGLTFASATVSQGTYVSTTGAWTVGTLASGATATLLLRATVGTSEQRTNTATATADQFDPISANNTASDSVIPQQSDLVIGKAVDNPTPNLGDTVVFTVVVQNSGPNVATGVQVTDPLPAGLAFVSATTTQGTYASTTGLWVVGTLAVDGEARLEITARATTAPLVLNVARISDADQFDPNLDNNVAGTPVDPQEAELVLTKSVNNNRPNVGDQVIFTVTLTNLGADPATGVQITDNLPPGVVFVSASPDQGTFNAATGIWDVGTIPVDGTLRLDLTVSVVSPNAQLNAARVTDADQPDPNPQNNSASASIIPQQADLAVLKSVDDPRPNVGDTVTFTVTLSNLGKSTVTNVTLTDLLPAGLALVSATPTQGAYDSATGLWSVGTVTPRSAETLVLQARVVSPTPMTNIATVSASDQFDPFTSNNQAQAGVDPQQADLQVLKSVINPRPNVGDIVTFTVTLTNLGPDTATGVALTDLLPAGLAFVAAAADQGTYVAATGTWTVGNVTLNDPIDLFVQAQVVGPPVESATNTATVSAADQFDPDPSNNSASTVVTPRRADLAVAKAVDVARPNVGDVVTFTVTVTNVGPDAANGVSITDLLPADLVFVSATPSQGTYSAATGVWTVGSIPSPGSVTLQIAARVTDGEIATNTATVAAAAEFDPISDNNSASVDVHPLVADVSVTKTVDNPKPNVGKTVTYTVTVTNNGPDTADYVVVTDFVPVTQAFQSSVATVGAHNVQTGTWTIGTLVSGASATLTVTVQVLSPSAVTNVAVVQALQFDPNYANNVSSVTVVPPQADVRVIKRPSTRLVAVGQTMFFTIDVTNLGPDAATNVVVTDRLPAGLTFVGVSQITQGTYNRATGRWSVGTLGSGASARLRIQVRVTSAGSITNTVTATEDQFDPVLRNNRSLVSILARVPGKGGFLAN